MKKSSKVLGIVGCIIAFVLAGAFLFVSLSFRGPGHPWLVSDIPEGQVQVDSGVAGQIASLVAACFALIASILGLCGSLNVMRKPTFAGVLMMIAAVFSLLSYFNILSFILFLIGAILALKKDRTSTQPITSE